MANPTYQGNYSSQELHTAYGDNPYMKNWAQENREAAGRMLDAQRMRGMSGTYGEHALAGLGMQHDMYGQYGQMAAGEGPSLAQAQLQQGLAAASQQATQQALQARGGNAAGAQQAMAHIGASMGGQAAMDTAQLRQQEQMAAMQAQSALAGQIAAQGQQGQMSAEQLGQANMQAGMEYELGRRQSEVDARKARTERNLGWYEAGLPGTFPSDERVKTNIEPADDDDVLGGILGLAGGGGLGSLIALSDERAKRSVRPGNLAASQAIGELDPYRFEYEAGYGPAGEEHIGVMAQDMERAYPQAVVDVGGVKHLDTAKATGLALAAGAENEHHSRELDARMARLEAALAGPQGGF